MTCPHGFRYTELECLYSPSHWSSKKPPNLIIDSFITAMRQCYQQNQRSIPLQQAVPYGEGNQKIDIWGNEEESTAAMILFHGGYWQEGGRELFTSPVKILIDEGFVVGCVGYNFATTIPLRKVIEQATNVLEFLEKRWPRKILSLGGHSAGAHLALSALQRSEKVHRFQKVVLFSGIFELSPLVGTYIGEPIKLSAEEAETATIASLDSLPAELLTVVGADESAKFKEQSKRLVENYLNKRCYLNISDCYKEIADEDHFSLIISLHDKNSVASSELRRFLHRGCHSS